MAADAGLAVTDIATLWAKSAGVEISDSTITCARQVAEDITWTRDPERIADNELKYF